MNKYEDLYGAFNRHPKPETFEGCPCCIEKKEIDLLLSKNLHSLSADELSNYASSVFLTVGSKKDYFYFFPRILELSLEDKLDWPSPEVVFRSIVDSGWNSWKSAEKEIVLKLFKSKFTELVKTTSEGSDIDEWLCAISHIQKDLGEYLLIFEENASNETYNDFIEWNMDCFTKGKLDKGFGEDCPEQKKQVVDWLHNDKSAAYLFSQYGMKI